MEKQFVQQFHLEPRSSAELRAIVRRFERKWQHRKASLRTNLFRHAMTVTHKTLPGTIPTI